MEFGIFNDEGQVERGFVTRQEAEQAMATRYDADSDLHVAECCHDHPEQKHEGCEDCNSEEEDA